MTFHPARNCTKRRQRPLTGWEEPGLNAPGWGRGKPPLAQLRRYRVTPGAELVGRRPLLLIFFFVPRALSFRGLLKAKADSRARAAAVEEEELG